MIALKRPVFFGAGQLGEQICSGVVFPRYVVHLKAFEVVNESFDNMVVLEQHYFLSLVSISNFPLDKLQVCVAS